MTKSIAELFEGYEGDYQPCEIDWGEPVGHEAVWLNEEEDKYLLKEALKRLETSGDKTISLEEAMQKLGITEKDLENVEDPVIDTNADINRPLTAEELKMLEIMQANPAVPNEDCPELTDEQISQIKKASRKK